MPEPSSLGLDLDLGVAARRAGAGRLADAPDVEAVDAVGVELGDPEGPVRAFGEAAGRRAGRDRELEDVAVGRDLRDAAGALFAEPERLRRREAGDAAAEIAVARGERGVAERVALVRAVLGRVRVGARADRVRLTR